MNMRVRTLRKALHLSQKEFAEKIGLKQNSVSCIEKGKSCLTEQNIKNICSQFYVNETWLRTGEGEMLDQKTKSHQEFFECFEKLPPSFQDYMIHMVKTYKVHSRNP